jgi:hypothetical protein
MTIFTAWSLEINSHTPSEANIINLSDSNKFISVISGIAVTPTSAAA